MTLQEQRDALARGVEAFAASVEALDEGLFLDKLGGWTPRDIVAHLVGWNRHIVRGAEQILRGELPFYNVDPGPDYARVNAQLVRRYDATDRTLLLRQLSESAGELTDFLEAMDPAEWDRDFGVRHAAQELSVPSTAGDVVTVKSTVDDLIADYHHHRAQIEGLRTG